MMTGGSGSKIQMMQHQADAVISQANPVSTTLYTVLDTTKNVRIISIACSITWAVTQPTPIEIVVTVDGQTIIFSVANPVSAAQLQAYWGAYNAANAQDLLALVGASYERASPFLLEGRSVKVEIRITWATTQPTPLVCRVKYQKIP